MLNFFVADLSPQGELRQITEYDDTALERISCAGDLISHCSAELLKNAQETEIMLGEIPQTRLRWRATASSAGIVTVRRSDMELVSVSIIAAGLNKDADATTIAALQQHLLRELLQTPFEPAFDLLQIKQRPLVATMTFPSAGEPAEQFTQALADRCFGAAYFRHLGLDQPGSSVSR